MKQLAIIITIIIILSATAFFFQSGCGICGIPEETHDITPSPTPGDTPEPTPEPTVTPDPEPHDIGTVWIHPPDATVDMSEDVNFLLDVYVNTGSQKLAAYGIVVTFEITVMDLNPGIGTDGVEAGPEGFITAVNTDTPGTLVVSGFDISGTGPGTALHILTIHFIAQDTGSSSVGLTVEDLADDNTNPIGTPTGVGGNVEVISGK